MPQFSVILLDKKTGLPTGDAKRLTLTDDDYEKANYNANGKRGGFHNTVTDRNDKERYMIFGVECEKGNGCFCQWHARPVGKDDVP